jgi:hypothetical protein
VAKRHNPRLVKIHWNYTVSELAKVLGAAKLTVKRWIDDGLPVIDRKRPLLLHGADVRAYLEARRPKKQPLRPGQFYCLPCRAPRRAAFDLAEFRPTTPKSGMLEGLCPDCGAIMYRVVRTASLAAAAGDLEVTIRPARRRISDTHSGHSSVRFKVILRCAEKI